MLIQGTKFDSYHIHVYSSRNVKFDSDNASILAHNCTYKLENRNKFVYYAKTEFRAQFTCSNLLIFYLFLFMENVRKFWCFLFKFIILILRVLFRIFFLVFLLLYIFVILIQKGKRVTEDETFICEHFKNSVFILLNKIDVLQCHRVLERIISLYIKRKRIISMLSYFYTS